MKTNDGYIHVKRAKFHAENDAYDPSSWATEEISIMYVRIQLTRTQHEGRTLFPTRQADHQQMGKRQYTLHTKGRIHLCRPMEKEHIWSPANNPVYFAERFLGRRRTWKCTSKRHDDKKQPPECKLKSPFRFTNNPCFSPTFADAASELRLGCALPGVLHPVTSLILGVHHGSHIVSCVRPQ